MERWLRNRYAATASPWSHEVPIVRKDRKVQSTLAPSFFGRIARPMRDGNPHAMPELSVAGGSLHYDLAGQGSPVLLIHGVGVLGCGWRPQVNGLSANHQLLTFDNRGIGQSRFTGQVTIEAMAADALALMDAAGWGSAHIVGHSMGGVIAQQIALNAPGRVRSLSLISTFARGKDGARLTPWVLWMTVRTRLGTRAMRRRAFLEMLYPSDYLATAKLDALAMEVGALIGRDLALQPPVILKQVQALGRHDISARLGALKGIRTQVISGRHDPIARPEYGRRLAELIPQATYEEVADASHGVTLQMPEWINERLRRHFAVTEAAGRSGRNGGSRAG